MTIDEAIAQERQKAKAQRSYIGTWDEEYSKKCEGWAEEHEQLAEWLEELKRLREEKSEFQIIARDNYEIGYNKAIDDFVEKFIFKAVCEGCSGCCNCYENDGRYECEDFKQYMKIAERLKEGKKLTNAEKIRNMTDEKLAEFIVGLNDHCLAGIGEVDCSKNKGSCNDSCLIKTIEWLKSE